MTKEFIQTCEEFIQIIPRDFCSSVVSGMLAPNRTDGRMCGTFCIATQAEKKNKQKTTTIKQEQQQKIVNCVANIPQV